jgi:hypothetical protein
MDLYQARHPREGGGQSPDFFVRAETHRRGETPLRLCVSARNEKLIKIRRPVMDSRLRGNDEIWDGDVARIAGATCFAPSCLRVIQI